MLSRVEGVAGMDGELMRQLAEYGPWGIAAAVLVFLRREIGAVLSAPKEDRAVERLLAGMNEQFISNMKLFVETNGRLDRANALLGELLAVQRDIHTEMVRRRK